MNRNKPSDNPAQRTFSEHDFLRSVFLPDRWKHYAIRTHTLASGNAREWETIDFPVEIAVELTNYCNLRCVMCPSPSLKRPRGHMVRTVFEKIVADICNEKGFLFLPQGFGEPLLHQEWADLIGLASASGISPIVVLSNGMRLYETQVHKLMDAADVLIVTIDGITPATYAAIRVGGELETVTRNISRFLTLRGPDGSPRLVLRMIRMPETEKEIRPFTDFWNSRIGGQDMIQIAEYNDWAGQVSYKDRPTPPSRRRRGPCRMLWKNLSVFHDGRVSPCCYDAESELIVGHAARQTLREIWNGPDLAEIRALHMNHQFDKIPLCSGCRSWL